MRDSVSSHSSNIPKGSVEVTNTSQRGRQGAGHAATRRMGGINRQVRGQAHHTGTIRATRAVTTSWERGRQRPQPTPGDPHQAVRQPSRPEQGTWHPREPPPETLISAGRHGGVQPCSAQPIRECQRTRQPPRNHRAGGSCGPSSGTGIPGSTPLMNPEHNLGSQGRVSDGILTGFW